jgi:hypothetical protein
MLESDKEWLFGGGEIILNPRTSNEIKEANKDSLLSYYMGS